MTITDIITLTLSVFLLAIGDMRGFTRSIIGPASLIIASILSVVYYQTTKNFAISLLIGLLGPFLLSLVLKFLMTTFAQATSTDMRPNFLSRVLGAIITLAWGWVFIFLMLILLGLMPPQGDFLTRLHNDVTKSFSYKITAPWVAKFLPASQTNFPAVTNVASSPDAQALAQDPRFQQILQDPDIQQDITNHDMAKLMSNPKIMTLTQQMMSDPAMMKKVMAVWQHAAQPQQNQNPSP